jgi:hypothetical protein
MASITSKGDGERVTSYANSIIHPAATPTATLLCMDPPRSLPTSFAPLRPPQRRSHHFLSRAFDSSRLQNVFKVAPLYTVPGNNIKNAFGFVRRVQIRGAGGTGATQATHPPSWTPPPPFRLHLHPTLWPSPIPGSNLHKLRVGEMLCWAGGDLFAACHHHIMPSGSACYFCWQRERSTRVPY